MNAVPPSLCRGPYFNCPPNTILLETLRHCSKRQSTHSPYSALNVFETPAKKWQMRCTPVSYTHLDVYKRQGLYRTGHSTSKRQKTSGKVEVLSVSTKSTLWGRGAPFQPLPTNAEKSAFAVEPSNAHVAGWFIFFVQNSFL